MATDSSFQEMYELRFKFPVGAIVAHVASPPLFDPHDVSGRRSRHPQYVVRSRNLQELTPGVYEPEYECSFIGTNGDWGGGTFVQHELVLVLPPLT